VIRQAPGRVSADGQAEDRDRLARVASGDAAALGELYDRYGRVVFGMAYAMLGSPEAAEEVAQDAFERMWRDARSYQPDRGSVRTWLFAIARNAAIDRYRRTAPRTAPERPLDDGAELADPDAEVFLERAVRAGRVRDALRALPVEQRTVIVLSFYGGYAQSEIASRLQVPLGTVKGRARLGLAKLRAALAEDAS
jgi:RNA polymerase sigma-70 factor, ECF subfamily